MTILDYHRLKAAEVEARDLERIEAAVRSRTADFPEHVESLLPPAEEMYRTRAGWPNYRKLHSLCELYLSGTSEQRIFIRSRINWKRAYQLGLFRIEATEIAVHAQSADLLRLALAALAINDLTCGDARDAILAVGPLLLAARKIEADWDTLVHDAAAVSGPGMAALLLDFLKNHPS